MKHFSMRRRGLLSAAALLTLSGNASAQSGAARIVVGFPPGGAADGLARLLAEQLRDVVAATVIVDNRVGAGSRIAADHVKNAPPDGTVTLLAPDGVMALYPHVYKKLTYEPERDFAPVTRLVNMALVVYVGPAVPNTVRTLADYVGWVKADPKRLVYGTPAAGAGPHFLGAMVAKAADLDMAPVHYKGGAPAIQDLVAGLVPAVFGSISDGLAMVNAGRIRALAVSSANRTSALPLVPTFAELGQRDLTIEVGLGVYAPAKTPPDVVAKLNAAIQKALQTDALKVPIQRWGFDVSAEGPEAFAARTVRERKHWEAIVRSTGFQAMD